MKIKITRRFALYCLMAHFSILLFSQENYKTSWLGNTFGFGDGKWVQNHVNAMYVAPDGTCFTQSYWDEGHDENSVYKDGDKIGTLGMEGGLAVGGNGDTIFCATGQSIAAFNAKTRVSYPSSAFRIQTVSGVKIYAIAAANGYLAVSDPNNDKILIYRTSNSGETPESISVERPADIAIDKNDVLWVVQSPNSYAGERVLGLDITTHPAKILSFDLKTKQKRSTEITGTVGWYPSAISVDPQNRLLVCDNGMKSQVYCFKNLNSTPQLDASFFNNGIFGEENGIYTPNPTQRGLITPHRLYELAGVGCDSDGNLYISLGGPVPRGDNPLMDTDIRKYNAGTGSMVWQLLGKEFVDMGDLDPDDNTAFYTKDTRYKLDWSKTTPSSEWSYYARIVNPYQYPQDPRTKALGSYTLYSSVGESTFMRRVADDQGKRHLFMHGAGMAGDQLPRVIYRFNKDEAGEVAIPSVVLSKSRDNNSTDPWPFNRPMNNCEFLWTDKNGDGLMTADEYEVNTYDDYPYHNGGWVDAWGGIWTVYRDRGIRNLPVISINDKGVPLYSFSNREYYALPKEMQDAHYVRYIGGSEDVMYIAGWTRKNSAIGDAASGVNTLVKYTNWKTDPTLVWESQPALYTMLKNGASFDVAGDYIFVGFNNASSFAAMGTVWIFSAETGAYLCEVKAGPEVGEACGWLDIWDSSLKAHKVGNEYVIFLEEDWRGKTIIYRWTPKDKYPDVVPESLSISPQNIELFSNMEMSLSLQYNPYNTNVFDVTWKSSDPEVATVSEKGTIKGLKNGTVTITATSKNGKTATCTVKVEGLDDTHAYKAIELFNDYEIGSNLEGAEKGIGWAGPWTSTDGAIFVGDKDLLNNADGSHAYSKVKGHTEYYRDLSLDYYLDDNQEYWMSFDTQGLDITEASWGGVALFNRDRAESTREELLFIGYGWQSQTICVLSNGDDPQVGTGMTDAIKNTTFNMATNYVLKIKAQNGGNPMVYLWLNYKGNTAPSEADADIVHEWSRGLLFPFNCVRIAHGDTFSMAYDNIRLGLTWEDLSYEGLVGINNQQMMGITIMPTLVDSYFDVLIDNPEFEDGALIIEVLDSSSKIVKSLKYDNTKAIKVNVDDLSTGVYFVSIKNERHIYTRKFIKK